MPARRWMHDENVSEAETKLMAEKAILLMVSDGSGTWCNFHFLCLFVYSIYFCLKTHNSWYSVLARRCTDCNPIKAARFVSTPGRGRVREFSVPTGHRLLRFFDACSALECAARAKIAVRVKDPPPPPVHLWRETTRRLGDGSGHTRVDGVLTYCDDQNDDRADSLTFTAKNALW